MTIPASAFGVPHRMPQDAQRPRRHRPGHGGRPNSCRCSGDSRAAASRPRSRSRGRRECPGIRARLPGSLAGSQRGTRLPRSRRARGRRPRCWPCRSSPMRARTDRPPAAWRGTADRSRAESVARASSAAPAAAPGGFRSGRATDGRSGRSLASSSDYAVRCRAPAHEERADDRAARAVDRRYGPVDSRYGAIDSQYGAIDFRYGPVDSLYGAIDLRYGPVDSRYGAPDRRYGAVDSQFGAVDRRFRALDSRYGAIDRRSGARDRQETTCASL